MTREKPEFLRIKSIRLNSSASSETFDIDVNNGELKAFVESRGQDYYQHLLKLVTELKEQVENLYAD